MNNKTTSKWAFAWMLLGLLGLGAALSNRSPITRGYLTTDLDANAKSITNIYQLLDTNGDPIGGGGGGAVTGSYAFNAVYPLTNLVSGTTVTYGVTANYSNGIVAAAGAVAANADATLSNNIIAIIDSEIGDLGTASSNYTAGVSNALIAMLATKVDEMDGFSTNQTLVTPSFSGAASMLSGSRLLSQDGITTFETMAAGFHWISGEIIASLSNGVFNFHFVAPRSHVAPTDPTHLARLAEITALGTASSNMTATASNELASAKMNVDGGNAASVVTIGPLVIDTPDDLVDVSGAAGGILFGSDVAIKPVGANGLGIYSGATPYMLFNGSLIAFGIAPPTSAVAADSTGEIVRWDEWSGINQVISNLIASVGSNITNTFRPRRETFQVFLTGGTNAMTVGTNAVHWMVPYAMQVTGAVLAVHPGGLPTGSQVRVTAHVNGTNFFSTPLHIDATERTSLTAATNYVFAFTNHHRLGDSFTYEVLQMGATLPGNGLLLTLYGQEVFP